MTAALCTCGHRLANHEPPTLLRDAGRCLRSACTCAAYRIRRAAEEQQ